MGSLTSICDWGTYARKDQPTNNFESQNLIQVGWGVTNAFEFLGFLTWDISSIPKCSTIISADLQFYVVVYTAVNTVTISRVLRQDMVSTQATWNAYKTGSNWTTAGCKGDGTDFTSTNSVTYAAVSNGEYINLSITDMLQDAVNAGDANLILKFSDNNAWTNSNIDTIYDEAVSTVAFRPVMTITWTSQLLDAQNRSVINGTPSRSIVKSTTRTVKSR